MPFLQSTLTINAMIHNLTSLWSHFLPDTHTTVFGCYGWFSLIDFCHSPSTSGGHRSIHLLYVFLVSLLSLHPCLTVLPTALAICPWCTCTSKTLHGVKFNCPSLTAFTWSTQGFKNRSYVNQHQENNVLHSLWLLLLISGKTTDTSSNLQILPMTTPQLPNWPLGKLLRKQSDCCRSFTFPHPSISMPSGLYFDFLLKTKRGSML